MTDDSKKKQIRKASLGDLLYAIKRTKNPRIAINYPRKNSTGFCYGCGQKTEFIFKNIINDNLTNEWQLNNNLRRLFDIRESTKCINCSTSLRSNLHAKALCEILAPESRSLAELVNENNEFRKLKIAEINACGALHQFLKYHPKLLYSEFMPSEKSTKHQDLTRLTYADASIDLVLTSETIEHIPQWREALKEIHRVLKDEGMHIFTIPTILTRKTRSRAIIENGKLKLLLPKSFHGCTRNVSTDDYIVCNEFGVDIINELEEMNFETKLYYTNIINLNDPNFVIVTKKLPGRDKDNAN